MIAIPASFLLSSSKASLVFSVLTSAILMMGPGGWQLARGQTRSETSLRSRAQLLGSQVTISFPERLVVTPSGKAYLLDTDLSTLFTIDKRDGRINRMCGSETLSGPSDISVDRNGNVWVLSALHSQIVKLTPKCQAQAQVISRNMPLRIATNTLGELIVLNGTGEHLFELYGPDGKLLRNFGKRLDYKDETANSELSDGRDH